jgi:hypothetical protein
LHTNPVPNPSVYIRPGILTAATDSQGTLNTYSHVLPVLQEDAASKMDAILTGSKQ